MAFQPGLIKLSNSVSDMLFALANEQQSFGEVQARHIKTSGEIAKDEAQYQAKVSRQQIAFERNKLNMNLVSDALNTQRQLRALSRRRTRAVGSILAKQGASGINVASRSSQLVRKDAHEEATREILFTKQASENRRRAMRFQSGFNQIQAENRARALDQRAEAAVVQAYNRAFEAVFSANLRASNTRIQAMKAGGFAGRGR
jgi:hypothetical protein